MIFYLFSSFFFFWDFTFFIKRPYVWFIHTLIMFKHVNLGKHIWIQRQKLTKNMLVLKFHPGMNCLHVFFSFFHSGMKSHPCLSSWDKISSRQKRVSSKIHFTIDRDDFIPGWSFTCKHPLIEELNYLYRGIIHSGMLQTFF